jgi:hypothetical protein
MISTFKRAVKRPHHIYKREGVEDILTYISTCPLVHGASPRSPAIRAFWLDSRESLKNCLDIGPVGIMKGQNCSLRAISLTFVVDFDEQGIHN